MTLSKVQWHQRGITLPVGMNFESWLELGRNLQMIEGAIQFAIGDLLNYGERNYGEKYLQLAEETGYTHGSLRNMSWVAREIPLHQRDPDITFSHYRALAALPSDKRVEWMKKIKETPMSVGELRGRLKSKGEAKVMVYIDQEKLNDIRQIALSDAPSNTLQWFKDKWGEPL